MRDAQFDKYQYTEFNRDAGKFNPKKKLLPNFLLEYKP